MQNLYEQHVKVERKIKEKLFDSFLEFLGNDDVSYVMDNFMFRKIYDDLEINLSDLSLKVMKLAIF